MGNISRTPIRGDIAFCSQVPWLRTSLSIEQNILFSSPMDRNWFNTVVRACALDVDFGSTALDSRLAKGLSGGQKARIVSCYCGDEYRKFDRPCRLSRALCTPGAP